MMYDIVMYPRVCMAENRVQRTKTQRNVKKKRKAQIDMISWTARLYPYAMREYDRTK